MSDDLEHRHWLGLARQQLTRGDVRGAIEILRRMLGEMPDSASGHALLAICLVQQKRLAAAEHEAREALALEPESALGRMSLAGVHLARHRARQAEALYREVLAESQEPIALRGLAQSLEQQGRKKEARAALDEALALEPEDVDTLVLRGELAWRERRFADAEADAAEALTLEPEHAEALILRGHLLLRRGKIEEAREHALWALRSDATSRTALVLLAAVKARQSWWLGLWWRFNTFATGSQARIMTILLGLWVAARVAEQIASLLQASGAATGISTIWLAFCAYTWVAPGMFRRMVERELEPVHLSDRY